MRRSWAPCTHTRTHPTHPHNTHAHVSHPTPASPACVPLPAHDCVTNVRIPPARCVQRQGGARAARPRRRRALPPASWHPSGLGQRRPHCQAVGPALRLGLRAAQGPPRLLPLLPPGAAPMPPPLAAVPPRDGAQGVHAWLRAAASAVRWARHPGGRAAHRGPCRPTSPCTRRRLQSAASRGCPTVQAQLPVTLMAVSIPALPAPAPICELACRWMTTGWQLAAPTAWCTSSTCAACELSSAAADALPSPQRCQCTQCCRRIASG